MTWQQVHGSCLVLAAGCIPLGEGVTFVGLGGLAACLLVRRGAVQWDIVRHGALARILGPLLVWLGAGVLAVALSREGWLKPGELGRWSPYLTVPLVLWSTSVLPRVWLSRAAAAFLACLAASAASGLCQYALDWHWGHGMPKPQALVPGTLRAVASGFYLHRLKLAHVLLVGILGLMARQMHASMGWSRRLLELLGAALMLAALLFTFTRGAFLGLGAGFFACALLASWRWCTAAALLALAMPLLLAGSPQVRARLASMNQAEATSVRGVIWSQGVQIIADHPLGVGLGNYSPIVARYYDAMDPLDSPRTYPHNILLAAWAEAGPVGLVAYAWAWIAFMAVCVQRLRARSETADASTRAAAAAGLAGAVAFWVVGMTHDVLYHNAVGFAFCGLVAFTLSFLFSGSERLNRTRH